MSTLTARHAEGEGVRVYVVFDKGEETYHSIRLEFKTTNYEAEYGALLVGLTIKRTLDSTDIKVKMNSEILANHVKWKYVVKSKRL